MDEQNGFDKTVLKQFAFHIHFCYGILITVPFFKRQIPH